jgi:hypothetical protein
VQHAKNILGCFSGPTFVLQRPPKVFAVRPRQLMQRKIPESRTRWYRMIDSL